MNGKSRDNFNKVCKRVKLASDSWYESVKSCTRFKRNIPTKQKYEKVITSYLPGD